MPSSILSRPYLRSALLFTTAILLAAGAHAQEAPAQPAAPPQVAPTPAQPSAPAPTQPSAPAQAEPAPSPAPPSAAAPPLVSPAPAPVAAPAPAAPVPAPAPVAAPAAPVPAFAAPVAPAAAPQVAPTPAAPTLPPGQFAPAQAAPTSYQPPPGYILVPAPLAEDPASATERARAWELMQLNLRRNTLLASNRRWGAPAVTLVLGATALIVGGALFHSAWNGGSYYACNEYGCDGYDSYNLAKDRAGLVLMPVGAAITIVSLVTLIIRGSRAKRLRRVEQKITKLGGQFSLAPASRGPGGPGATALLRW